MARKGIESNFYKDGGFTGWADFRYGESKAKPVTLAGSRAKPKRIINGEKRKHVVDQVVQMLRAWRSTPFENEAAARHGLRSGFCIDGHPWRMSDHEAEAIVAEAFRRIGAKRPSFEEGQRQYTIPPENCSWCGVAIPEELNVGDHSTRFCCAEHAKLSLMYRDFRVRDHQDRAYADARAIIRRTGNPALSCGHCGRIFRPQFAHSKFCSDGCYHASRVKHEPKDCENCGKTFKPIKISNRFCSTVCHGIAKRSLPMKQCLSCGETFRPKNHDQKYCSQPCMYKGLSEHREKRICECCGTTFEANRNRALYCSVSCQKRMTRMREGRFPKEINAPAFDFLFTKPVNAAPRRLTPTAFDRLFEAA